MSTFQSKWYRLADGTGMSRVSGESVDTLPRGHYIGWHPRIIQGCLEYPWKDIGQLMAFLDNLDISVQVVQISKLKVIHILYTSTELLLKSCSQNQL